MIPSSKRIRRNETQGDSVNQKSGEIRVKGTEEIIGNIDDYGNESMAGPVFDTKGIMLSAGLALFGGLILMLTVPTSLTPLPSVGSVFSPPSQNDRWKT